MVVYSTVSSFLGKDHTMIFSFPGSICFSREHSSTSACGTSGGRLYQPTRRDSCKIDRLNSPPQPTHRKNPAVWHPPRPQGLGTNNTQDQKHLPLGASKGERSAWNVLFVQVKKKTQNQKPCSSWEATHIFSAAFGTILYLHLNQHPWNRVESRFESQESLENILRCEPNFSYLIWPERWEMP